MTLAKLRVRSRTDKVFVTFAEAVADIPDGAMVIIGHFGGPGGMPMLLLRALRDPRGAGPHHRREHGGDRGSLRG